MGTYSQDKIDVLVVNPSSPSLREVTMPAHKKASSSRSGKKRPVPPAAPYQPSAPGNPVGAPVFNDPRTTADPLKYKVPHASDAQAYKEMDALIKTSKFLPLPFPVVAGVTEPVLTLAAALGSGGADMVAKIQQAQQIVFQTAGDTGATQGPKSENATVDKML